ncbi:MAG: hypothetical protein V1774_04590 [Candidatus Eisenbacteria bacterium]
MSDRIPGARIVAAACLAVGMAWAWSPGCGKASQIAPRRSSNAALLLLSRSSLKGTLDAFG